MFFLIQNFEKKRNFSSDSFIEAKLNEFYLICSLSNIYSLVGITDIEEKCVFLNNNSEYFISLLHDEEDHD